MAALPKIVYGVNRAVNVNFNENDALNVVKDGVTVFHKHVGNRNTRGGCYTIQKQGSSGYTARHYHSSSGCQQVSDGLCGGSLYYKGTNPPYVYHCDSCGRDFTDLMPYGHDKGWHWNCGMSDGQQYWVNTTYTYYDLSCGFDET